MDFNLTAKFIELEEKQALTNQSLDDFFLVTMGLIVFLMQAGFAFLEAGAVRSKNATNILIKNLFDSMFGCLAYWLFGYALAFGGNGNVFCGATNWALSYMDPKKYSLFFFQYVFAATATTIVSGAVAERCHFVAYVVYSILISGFIYPIVSHWAWDETGWMNKGISIPSGNVSYPVSYQDFAGSGVVHMVGGIAALIGAAFLGPRIYRFKKGDLEARPLRGHSVPLAALGGFLLIFGFFAFNGGSQLAISNPGDGQVVALAMINTIISAALAATVCLLAEKFIRKKNWSILISINGALTGMVAICAGCNIVYPWGAAVIGFFAGIAFIIWQSLMECWKIDDPLDAVAVHLGGGLWGVISVAFLNKDRGILFRWNIQSGMDLLWQMVGIFAIIAWTGFLCTIMFAILKYSKIFRVNTEIEEVGLDIMKHNEPAYPEQKMSEEQAATLAHYPLCKDHEHHNDHPGFSKGFDNYGMTSEEPAKKYQIDMNEINGGDIVLRRF